MLVITLLSSMYDFKGFHGKSSAEHHAGKDHGRTYRFVAPTSDTFFFLIPLAILEHGHMSLQEIKTSSFF